MPAYADTIARQFLSGLRTNKSHRLYEHEDTLYSYGPHYPVVIKEWIDSGAPVYWLNETPYYVNDDDRAAAGWERMGYAMRPARKRTASPTTKGHRQAVESQLRANGWEPRDETRTITTTGTDGQEIIHTLRLWTKGA